MKLGRKLYKILYRFLRSFNFLLNFLKLLLYYGVTIKKK